MLDTGRLIRENRSTTFMIFFLILLYIFLFFAGHFSAKNHEPLSEKKENALLKSELKQREEKARQNMMAKPRLMTALSLVFLAVLIAGIALDAYLLLRGFHDRPWAAIMSERPAVRWGFKEVASGFVFMFFIEGIIFISQTFWYWVMGLEKVQRDIFLLSNSIVRDLCVAAFVWMLVRSCGQSWRALGFKRERFLQNLKTGLLGYLAIIPPMLLGFFILAALMNFFSYEPLPQNVVQIYLKKNTTPYLFIFTLFVAVFGPVLEELFFRGFTYPALKKQMGTGKAMILTSLVFAAFHMNAAAFVPIFFLGLFLTYLYESTGSLVPSISAHVLHNALMVMMTLGFRAISA